MIKTYSVFIRADLKLAKTLDWNVETLGRECNPTVLSIQFNLVVMNKQILCCTKFAIQIRFLQFLNNRQSEARDSISTGYT